MGRRAFQVEGTALGISVNRDGLQLYSIAHTDVQLASKLICKNLPSSGHLLRSTPPSPVISHLDQCNASSQVCRLPASHPDTVCSPTAAKGGQSPQQGWPLFEQLSGSPQPHLAESGLKRHCLTNQVWQAPGSRQLGGAFTWWDH